MVGFLDGFCWMLVGVGMRFLGLVVLWYFPFCFVRALRAGLWILFGVVVTYVLVFRFDCYVGFDLI